MNQRKLSTAVIGAAGAAFVGAALALAAPGQAAPGGEDTAPPCLAEHTCALLIPKTPPRYLPLTPASTAPTERR